MTNTALLQCTTLRGQASKMSAAKQLLIGEERKFEMHIERSFPNLLRKFPTAPHISELQNRDLYLQYEIFSPKLIEKLDLIRAEHGQAALALYHKLSLCRLMADTLAKLDSDQYPNSILKEYGTWFKRITEDFSSQPDSYYNLNGRLWPLRKDIGVCSGRSIPVGGAWVIETRLVARRALIRRAKPLQPEKYAKPTYGFGALRKTLSDILWQTRIYPSDRRVSQAIRRFRGDHDLCFVIHTIERNIQDFNSGQMDLAYRNIASLLEKDRNVWGVYRSSWFLDPALIEISPSMAFLSQIPMSNGAELYYGGLCSADDIRKAVLLSPERSQLYKSGEYVPRNYSYFWPRQRLIDAFGHDKSFSRETT